MKPKIDITITDTNGAYSSLADGIEPYEVYVNNEPVCTSERLDELQAENAKLRELVRKYGEDTDQDRCEGCVCKSRCDNGDIDECWQLTEIRELARELGIEVEE